MKKVIAFVILLVALAFVLVGCQGDPNVLSTAAPSSEVLRTVRDAMWDNGYNVDLTNYPGYCKQAWYYGTINGCIVTFLETSLQAEHTIKVADCLFMYRTSFVIPVYKDGAVCTLEEAYEKGWLTQEHIAQLHVRHGQIETEFDQAYDKWRKSQGN